MLYTARNHDMVWGFVQTKDETSDFLATEYGGCLKHLCWGTVHINRFVKSIFALVGHACKQVIEFRRESATPNSGFT